MAIIEKKISAADLYARRKRRFLTELLQGAELRAASAWVSIHDSSKDPLVTYESEGLVVSVSGGGSIAADHPQAVAAGRLAAHIVGWGGVVISGGRNSGIMAACAVAAGRNNFGILFPELKAQRAAQGTFVMLNAPTPRVEVMGTCPPIVVIFRGGLGTLTLLMRAITHLSNRQYHPDQPPQLVFVSNYWVGLLTTMMNMGCLPREFLTKIHFFENADQIIKKIPNPTRT